MTISIGQLILVLATTPVFAAGPTLFEHWYTRYDPPWPDIITGNCSGQYKAYIYYDGTCLGSSRGRLGPTMSDVADCLLSYTPEIVIANMAAASVLLGLLPTVLSLAGSKYRNRPGCSTMALPGFTLRNSVASDESDSNF